MVEVLVCPVCKRPVPLGPEGRPAHFPFCSARCRTIDLGAWASGSYVVPGQEMGGQDLPGDRQEPTSQ